MCVGAYLYLSSENIAMRLKKHLALVTNQKENNKSVTVYHLLCIIVQCIAKKALDLILSKNIKQKKQQL